MDCYFCKHNIQEIDFKNTAMLRSFISGLGKIKPRKKTGTCAKHQRKITTAIKRARHLGLLSHIAKQ